MLLYLKIIGLTEGCTAQKMRFSIKDFFSKCDQTRRKLRIWSHLLKKSLMENFIFRAVIVLKGLLLRTWKIFMDVLCLAIVSKFRF